MKRGIIALLLALSFVLPVAAQEAPPPANPPGDKSAEALARARHHFEEAVKALGEAGEEAYQEHSGQMREKAQGALKDLDDLLKKWENLDLDKMLPQPEKPKEEGQQAI